MSGLAANGSPPVTENIMQKNDIHCKKNIPLRLCFLSGLLKITV